jgi:hypothetical protein
MRRGASGECREAPHLERHPELYVARNGETDQKMGGRRRRGHKLRGSQKKEPTDGGLCSDSCSSAHNGNCEDGGELLVRGPPPVGTTESTRSRVAEVRCDLGTDCTDCGGQPRPPRRTAFASLDAVLGKGSGADEPGASAPSLASLIERGIKVKAAWTSTQPPFIMPFTDGKADFDVSHGMESQRAVEPLYNLYWRRLTEQCCARGGLVLDVGANFGYYALFAAALGCHVLAWEPVPTFRAFLALGAALNNATDRLHVRSAVVGNVSGQSVNVRVPERGIWGTASVDGLNVDPSIKARVRVANPPAARPLSRAVAPLSALAPSRPSLAQPQQPPAACGRRPRTTWRRAPRRSTALRRHGWRGGRRRAR